jgi:hypothetical protein
VGGERERESWGWIIQNIVCMYENGIIKPSKICLKYREAGGVKKEQ